MDARWALAWRSGTSSARVRCLCMCVLRAAWIDGDEDVGILGGGEGEGGKG